ncbi:MAG: hypothetical protein ACXWW0_03770 [Bacteroidia bacterium]
MQTNERFYIGIGIEGYDGSALGEIDLFLDSCESVNLINIANLTQLIWNKIK